MTNKALISIIFSGLLVFCFPKHLCSTKNIPTELEKIINDSKIKDLVCNLSGGTNRKDPVEKQNKKIICHDIHNNQKKVDPTQLIFRPSVYGILIENNKVLLSKQWDGYDFPGGGIDVHETIEEALKREFLEETGIEVELVKSIACETSFFHPIHSKKNKDQYWNCPLIYFLVKKVGGKISKDNLDTEELEYVDEPEWIDLNKISDIKFYNSVDSSEIITSAFAILNKRELDN